MAPPKILVAGFGPFPGTPRNPSAALALRLAHSPRAARFARVTAAVLPTVYETIPPLLARLIEREQPDAVLMFGLAGSTPFLRIETRARNRASLFHADAARKKSAQTLVPGAAETLRVRAPVRHLLHAARGAGVQARLSADAGGYICNAALFHVLQAAHRKPAPLAAFVHIPRPRGRGKRRASVQSSRPAMAALTQAGEAILIALARAAKTKA